MVPLSPALGVCCMSSLARGIRRAGALLRRQRPCWEEGGGVIAAPSVTVTKEGCLGEPRRMMMSTQSATERNDEAREESSKLWRAQQLSDALRVLRTGTETRAFTQKRALLHLKYYASHLEPQDALRLFNQSVLLDMANVARAAMEQLQATDESLAVLLEHVDGMVERSCQGGKFSLAMALLDTAKQHQHRASAASYRALFRLLGEKGRYVSTWEFAEVHGREGAAPDVEGVALAMLVCWRARKWASVQRLLESLVLSGGLPRPPPRQQQQQLGGGGGAAALSSSQETLACLLSLIDSLARSGASLDADYCNMVLRAYIKMGRVDDAMAYMQAMGASSQPQQHHDGDDEGDGPEVGGGPHPRTPAVAVPLPAPNGLSFSLLLDALGQRGQWEACLALMGQTRGVLTQPAQIAMVYKTAIAALGKVGMWEGAMTLFYEMHERGIHIDTQTYTTVAKALKDGRQWEAALRFVEVMKKQDATPSRMTYNVILSALGQAGQVDRALTLFDDMQADGLPATSYEYGTLISACGRSGMVDEALRLLRKAETDLMKPQQQEDEEEQEEGGGGASPSAALLLGHDDGGGGGDSSEVMMRDKQSTTLLDNCYLQVMRAAGDAGRWKDAVMLLEERERRPELGANFSFYREAIRACGKAGKCDMALSILDSMKQRGVRGHIICYNAAMEACQVAGRWEDALALLGRMRRSMHTALRPGNFCYTRAMQACVQAGVPDKALPLLAQMQRDSSSSSSEKEGYSRPDISTYGTHMMVCGHAGQWEMVLKTLKDMETRGGVRPDALSYVHAARALVQCGRVKEAVGQVLEVLARRWDSRSGADRPKLLAHHVVLLGAMEAGDWDSFDRARELMEASGLLPTALTQELLEAGSERRGGRQAGGATSACEEEERLGKLREAIEMEASRNPHNPLRRAKLEVLGYRPPPLHNKKQQQPHQEEEH